MGFKMNKLDQQIIKFKHKENFKNDDFYLSKSNQHVFNYLNKWPRWEKNLLNIVGKKFSGKSHLIDIFIEKFRGIVFKANSLDNVNLRDIKIQQNIVLENLDNDVDEKLIYTLINIVEQDNKYLIITSNKPLVDINFNLKDLESRFKNFIIQNIEKPDDELIYALILKNLSDRQISLDNKLINYIINRIDRSYGKIFEFIYKVDEMSLKQKKSINLKIIKEVLEE